MASLRRFTCTASAVIHCSAATQYMRCSFLRGACWLGPRYRVVIVSPNGGQLEAIGKLVEEGKVKPIIHSVLPLEKAA